MNIAIFEDASCSQLYPLTWLRAAFELRCGRDLLLDKIRRHLGTHVVHLWTRPELRAVIAERFATATPDATQGACIVNARALIAGDVQPPTPGTAWRSNGDLIAAGVHAAEFALLSADIFLDRPRLEEWLQDYKTVETPESVRLINYPWELALLNEAELHRQCRDGGVRNGDIHAGAHLIQKANIHIASGASVKPGAVLDAENGPIFIDRGAKIEANAVLEGPCYVGERSIVRPGASIRAGTTIGPVCKVGGEIEASIIHGFSNKQHDGFLGHSYIAEWVNLGADTVTSDLKNTYGAIRCLLNGVGIETGQLLVGSIIGDHAKTGIGTILPTGCIIGVASNVFTPRGVPKFVPSFAWLTDEGMTATRVDKAVQIAETVMGRRDLDLTPAGRALLEHVATAAREVESAGWA